MQAFDPRIVGPVFAKVMGEQVETQKAVGVPSTEIIASDATRKDFPFDYQIMVPLKGKDLEVEWAGTREQYDKLSFELGRLIAKQYQLPGKGWGRWQRRDDGVIIGSYASHNDYFTGYLDHDLEVLALFGLSTPQGIESLNQFFTSTDLKSLFCDENQSYFVHHDIADHNIRYRGNRILAL